VGRDLRASSLFRLSRFVRPIANAVVDQIAPGSQIADRSGLRVGDIIDVSKMTLSERYRLFLRYSPPGTTITVTTVRADERHAIALEAEPFWSKRPRLSDVPFLVSATVSLVVIALIAWRRPSLATAA
jgi:S1-C subfamily serine protease